MSTPFPSILVRIINTSITITETMKLTEIMELMELMDKMLEVLSVTLWLIARLSR